MKNKPGQCKKWIQRNFFLAPSFLVCFRELLYKINIKSLPSGKLFSRASFIFNGEAALAALNEAYHLYADRPILNNLAYAHGSQGPDVECKKRSRGRLLSSDVSRSDGRWLPQARSISLSWKEDIALWYGHRLRGRLFYLALLALQKESCVHDDQKSH